MTNKSLILGLVVLCALPAATQAQVLLSENFNELTPANVNTPGPNAPVGPDFFGTNFRILGPGVGGATCGGPAFGNCLVLNGTTGVLTSKPVTLEPGSYFLSFELMGNRNAAEGTTNHVTVSLGPSVSRGFLYDDPFALPNRISHTTVTDHLITVSTPMSVELIFTSTGTLGANGTVVDNISLAAAPAVPEPATLGLMVLGLLGAGIVRRKRTN
jgi:hypothetical protein